VLSTNIDDILAQCQLFGQAKPASLAQLAAIAHLTRFEKGQVVFREGDPCPGTYIVGSGLVRVYKTAPNGKEHVLHMVGPGNTFAEVATIGRFACPANAQSVLNSTCVLLPADLFQKALESNHQLCLDLMAGMTYWVRHLVNLMEDVVLRDAIGRVARFVLDSEPAADGTVELPSLKRHVASHLNLTSETFSRTLSRLIEAGLVVEVGDNRLELRDPIRLRALAEGK